MRTVQLQHRMPDGSSHIDWMIEGRGDSEPGLIAFRLDVPLDEESPSIRLLMRATDHRRLYLDYEGAVSRDRGTVRRMYDGEATFEPVAADEWRLMLSMRRSDRDTASCGGKATIVLRGRLQRLTEGSWRILLDRDSGKPA